jgi:sugar phosphate isomerase/epimerase
MPAPPVPAPAAVPVSREPQPQPQPGPILNQATCETTSTPVFLAAAASAGFSGVALWRHQIDRTTAREVAAQGLTVSSVCRGGFFTGSSDDRPVDEDNRRAVATAVDLGAPVLVLVCGGAADGRLEKARGEILRGLDRLLPVAEDAGVALALEPFHPALGIDRSALVTLRQANDLLDHFDHPLLGVAIDTYHVWWDPDLAVEAARTARSSAGVLALHVADWPAGMTDVLNGRELPGDGVLPLADIIGTVRAAGYTGRLEAEVLNPTVWARPAAEVARVCADALHRLDQQASGGDR